MCWCVCCSFGIFNKTNTKISVNSDNHSDSRLTTGNSEWEIKHNKNFRKNNNNDNRFVKWCGIQTDDNIRRVNNKKKQKTTSFLYRSGLCGLCTLYYMGIKRWRCETTKQIRNTNFPKENKESIWHLGMFQHMFDIVFLLGYYFLPSFWCVFVPFFFGGWPASRRHATLNGVDLLVFFLFIFFSLSLCFFFCCLLISIYFDRS